MPARVAPDWPRMMKRSYAALYCDLTANEFEREVTAGRLPPPSLILGGEDHWCRMQIDGHLDRLSGGKAPDWRENAPIYQSRG